MPPARRKHKRPKLTAEALAERDRRRARSERIDPDFRRELDAAWAQLRSDLAELKDDTAKRRRAIDEAHFAELKDLGAEHDERRRQLEAKYHDAVESARRGAVARLLRAAA